MTKKESDWLPRNHETLYEKAGQTNSYLTVSTNRNRMGLASGTTQGIWYDNTYLPKYNNFKTTFTNWQNPATRTPIMTVQLEESEEVFIPLYRQLYMGFFRYSPFVTDDDLVSMGFPKRGTGGGGHHPVPDTYVETLVRLLGPAAIEIDFWNAGSKSKAKPRGVQGAEFKWSVGKAPVTDWKQLQNSSFDTHSPIPFNFDSEQRGDVFSYAARWENTTGEKGPWSEIRSIIIP